MANEKMTEIGTLVGADIKTINDKAKALDTGKVSKSGDTMTGNLTIDSPLDHARITIEGGGNKNGELLLREAGTANGVMLGYDGVTNEAFMDNYNGSPIRVWSSSRSSNSMDFKGTPTVNGNTVWHEGNTANPDDKVSKSGDTMTGSLNVKTGARNTSIAAHIEFSDISGSNASGMKFSATPGSAPIVGFGSHWNGDAQTITTAFAVGTGSTWYNGDLLKLSNTGSLTTVQQGTVWGSSNDGSGSGLDADLLDGQQGSYYATKASVDSKHKEVRSLGVQSFGNSATTAAFIEELRVKGAFNSSMSSCKASWSYVGNSDLATGHPTIGTIELAGSVIECWTDNTGDGATGTYTVRVTSANTGNNPGGVYVYNDQGATYSPGWRELFTSSTDGVGSGLDADLLDGQHGSYYATKVSADSKVSKSGDTMTGKLVTPYQATKSIYVGTDTGRNSAGDNVYVSQPTKTTGGWWGVNVEVDAVAHTAPFYPYRYVDTDSGAVKFSVAKDGNITVGTSTVYHEGNLTKSVIDSLNVWADQVDVNRSDVGAGNYYLTWNSGDTIYSSQWFTINRDDKKLTTHNIKVNENLELGSSSEATIKYNTSTSSIDFIIN